MIPGQSTPIPGWLKFERAKEAEVDIAAVQTEIVKLEIELKIVQVEIEKYLKELAN